MSRTSTLNTIDRFLQQVRTKTAAEANTEPGSIGGETSHPVKDVDDSTQDAKEGERSKENEEDVKKEQGKPGVDSTPENVAKTARAKKAEEGKSSDGSVNPPGTAADDQLQIGTKKQPTGEDPSVETQSVKAEKEDSETSHPARTNNSELDDFKYASYSIEKLEKLASELGNYILAAMSETETAPAKTKQAETKQATADEVDLAGQAGYELAGLVSGNFDKQAADAVVQATIEEIIKTASDDAEKVAVYLQSFYAAQQEQQQKQAAAQRQRVKRAEGPMPPVDPAMMAGGGAPPAGGGDPAAMMGGGAPPDGAPGAGGDEEMLMQLAQLIESGQLPPEVIEQLVAALGGAGGGDMGGGAPPPAPGADEGGPAPDAEDTAGGPEGMEVAAALKMASALMKAASTKKAKATQTKQQKSARDVVLEVISRSKK